MDLWQLRTFYSVAKNLHFTRAAEELHLSQPAVSHHIKALEKEIGEVLFTRHTEGISLTRAGRQVLRHADQILTTVEELNLEIQERKNSMTGRLVISAAIRGLNNPFPLLYQGFRRKYPGIELVFQAENTPADVAGKLRRGEISVGVLGKIDDLSELEYLPYGSFEFTVVAGAEHPLAGQKRVTAADLESREWIMFAASSRMREWGEKALGGIGVRPDRISETNDGAMILSMVSQGGKIAVLPVWGVAADIAAGKLVTLKTDRLETQFELICAWKKKTRTKSIEALVTYLLEETWEGVI